MSRWIDGDWLLNFFEPYPDDYQTPLGTLRACVDDAPSIEPKQGEWIIHFDDLFSEESTEECSICHAEQMINGNDDNYCPNCGARMKGADDE